MLATFSNPEGNRAMTLYRATIEVLIEVPKEHGDAGACDAIAEILRANLNEHVEFLDWQYQSKAGMPQEIVAMAAVEHFDEYREIVANRIALAM
jgi:hypothetical protein